MPKNPASLCDITFDEEWTISSDQEQFLIHDSGVDFCERMLTELNVIRVPLGQSAVTCVYAFLSNKHQSTSEELFTAIQDRCTELVVG